MIIKQKNARDSSFTLGHNKFSTWTESEYKRLLGFKAPKNAVKNLSPVLLNITDIPDSIDWREKGAVNPIKDQGQCGSCYAFSATAAIEGHHFIKSGELLSLSEQQLIDCDETSHGCEGGWQKWSMQYVEKHPQDLESDYKYQGKDDHCSDDKYKG